MLLSNDRNVSNVKCINFYNKHLPTEEQKEVQFVVNVYKFKIK